MQAFYYAVPRGFRGIDTASFTAVYLDLVYFCSIVITGIGFGDITPSHHITKLATSVVGGETYSVVLVGILISSTRRRRASRVIEALVEPVSCWSLPTPIALTASTSGSGRRPDGQQSHPARDS